MINKYIVHLNNGDAFEIYASNMSGAKAQNKSFAKFEELLLARGQEIPKRKKP